jgi:AcrR family transcriptional regulator
VDLISNTLSEYGFRHRVAVNVRSGQTVRYRTDQRNCPPCEEAAMSDDRRVRRTRRALHEALIELVLEKNYERISVQEILDRADVVRSTFYAHYQDKDGLLFSSFEEMLGQLRDAVATLSPADTARPAELLYQHAYQHRRVYRALCGRQGGNLVRQHLHRMVTEVLREHLAEPLAAAGSNLPVDLVATHYTTTTLGLLGWWVDHDFCHDPAWLAKAWQTLALPGLRTALADPTVEHSAETPDKRQSADPNLSTATRNPLDTQAMID